MLRIQTLVATAVLACSVSARADQSLVSGEPLKVPLAVPLTVQPFQLQQVRLLDGPFLRAQELDHKYLLSLDVDRLLHTFRLNAGLASSAAPFGGWEEPKTELRGHFAGHYLTGCSLMFATTRDERLKQKVDALVAGLAECQARLGNGYLSAYPEEFIDRVEARRRVWAPYYTLHKILAGLLDAYVYGGNTQALEVARKFGDWVVNRNAKLDEEQMQAMLGNEHGGMNEVMANLYALTGEKKYLETALRFNHQAVIGPASKGVDNLTGLHANTQIPKFVGTAREYELTGDKSLEAASRFFWETVVRERSYVIGGHSDGEGFSPKETLSKAFGPSTTETCNTYNMLKLTRHLFCWDPRVEYADYYERALFNHILASQDPESGMMCYYVPLRPGSRKVYNTPEDSFWCCTGTGVENHAKYGDSLFFHEGDRTLFVNLPIASELRWKEKGLTLRVETQYPESAIAELKFTCEQPVPLALKLRHPSWVSPQTEFYVDVNGDAVAADSKAGTWLTIDRTWKTGDTVKLVMPFSLRSEGFRDNPDRIAFLHGPLVLASEVEPSQPVPAIVGSLEHVLTASAPVFGRPSVFAVPPRTFQIPGGELARPVLLEPFYKVHGNRPYTVYWDVYTPEQWESREAEYKAEQARQKQLEAITLDLVLPGREQNERDHDLAGERTSTGPLQDRYWRHATDGGWFEWTLNPSGQRDVELWVTYWGDDSGSRAFDILFDGQRFATERLDRNRPGEFYVAKYPIPRNLTDGKERLKVRFQGHPENFAGGVFEVRLVRADKESR